MKFIKKCSTIGLEIGLAIPFFVKFYQFMFRVMFGSEVVTHEDYVSMVEFYQRFFSWLY